jgi:hypothetical protein
MAIASWFHCSVKTVSRSAGRSVVAAAAYRLGERLHETEIDQTHDYTRRHGVATTFTVAPADAPSWARDPEQLWNAASAAEKRKNSTLAREVELALPAAVSPRARANIARAMAQELVDRYGVAVSVGIHAPSHAGDQRNHHVHLLFTTRRMEADGLGAKTRVLDDRKSGPEEVTYLRAFVCGLINDALSDANSDERVDHRSFATRGIEDQPTVHLGPAGKALQRRDADSERAALNDEITTTNGQFDRLVEELAELDATIAAEEERQLDARYGAAEAEPEEPTPASVLAQLRQAAAQFRMEDLAFGPTKATLPRRVRELPKFDVPRDATEAAEQLRLTALPFVDAIRLVGTVPELIANVVDDGLKWFQRVGQHLVDLAEDARDSMVSWRDRVLGERDVHNRDDGLDIE